MMEYIITEPHNYIMDTHKCMHKFSQSMLLKQIKAHERDRLYKGHTEMHASILAESVAKAKLMNAKLPLSLVRVQYVRDELEAAQVRMVASFIHRRHSRH